MLFFGYLPQKQPYSYRFYQGAPMNNELLLKISCNGNLIFFNSENKDYFYLGKDKLAADIALDCPILSPKHLLFKKYKNTWYVIDMTDHSIFRYGKSKLKKKSKKKVKVDKLIELSDRSDKQKIYISAIKNIKMHRDFVEKNTRAGKANSIMPLTGKTEFFIGRDPSCDIVVDNPQVDPFNTKIIRSGVDFYVEDLKSSNGTCVNNELVKARRLTDYDFINIPSAVYMFLKDKLIYTTSQNGIDLDIVGLSKTVRDTHTHKPLKLLQDISMNVKAGDFVAVVGGSGAGKSTFLDAINGRRPGTEGKIYYDLNDYYNNILTYQSIIGYVPQRDIMHEELTVKKTLYYYAAIRMRHHLKKPEIYALIDRALADVSLTEKANVKITNLSGGQKKRVSIAMELLADPKIVFLDEPTSGLSPDLDYEIMNLLYNLAKNQGRTIIVITHAMENVDKCDKIAFLGKGGRLCYYGPPKKIFQFFGSPKYAQIFGLLSDDEASSEYADKFKQTQEYLNTTARFNDLYSE